MRCAFCDRVIREYRRPGRLSSYRTTYEPCQAIWYSSARYRLCSPERVWPSTAEHRATRHKNNNPNDTGRVRKKYVSGRSSMMKRMRRLWNDHGRRWRWRRRGR